MLKLEDIKLPKSYQETGEKVRHVRIWITPPGQFYNYSIIASDINGQLYVSIANAWDYNSEIPTKVIQQVKQDVFGDAKTKVSIYHNHPYICEVAENGKK